MWFLGKPVIHYCRVDCFMDHFGWTKISLFHLDKRTSFSDTWSVVMEYGLKFSTLYLKTLYLKDLYQKTMPWSVVMEHGLELSTFYLKTLY